MSVSVQPAVLAAAANLNRGWVTKASELGLVNLSSLDGEDLIVVRVFAVVDQLVWPGERKSRSVSRGMAPWQSLAVNAARAAAGDPSTRLESVLWVMPDGVDITHSAGEHAEFVVDRLRGRCVFSIPVGEWIAALPAGMQTIFHWPTPLSVTPPVVSGEPVQLNVFATGERHVTVIATNGGAAAFDAPTLGRIHETLQKQHPGTYVRIIERHVHAGLHADRVRWREALLIEGSPASFRQLEPSAVFAEFGPQLDELDRLRPVPRRPETRVRT